MGATEEGTMEEMAGETAGVAAGEAAEAIVAIDPQQDRLEDGTNGGVKDSVENDKMWSRRQDVDDRKQTIGQKYEEDSRSKVWITERDLDFLSS